MRVRTHTHTHTHAHAHTHTHTQSKLYMMSNHLTAQDAAAILDMMICLEELHISGNRLGDHGAELLSEGITNTKILRVLNISSNNIGPSGTTAIANALSNSTSLEELYMGDHNFFGQDMANALGSAIICNKRLRILSLWPRYPLALDTKSAMIIMRSLTQGNNSTITELRIVIRSHENEVSLITRKTEMINAIRKSHNEHIIDFALKFTNPQGLHHATYTINY